MMFQEPRTQTMWPKTMILAMCPKTIILAMNGILLWLAMGPYSITMKRKASRNSQAFPGPCPVPERPKSCQI